MRDKHWTSFQLVIAIINFRVVAHLQMRKYVTVRRTSIHLCIFWKLHALTLIPITSVSFVSVTPTGQNYPSTLPAVKSDVTANWVTSLVNKCVRLFRKHRLRICTVRLTKQFWHIPPETSVVLSGHAPTWVAQVSYSSGITLYISSTFT